MQLCPIMVLYFQLLHTEFNQHNSHQFSEIQTSFFPTHHRSSSPSWVHHKLYHKLSWQHYKNHFWNNNNHYFFFLPEIYRIATIETRHHQQIQIVHLVISLYIRLIIIEEVKEYIRLTIWSTCQKERSVFSQIQASCS